MHMRTHTHIYINLDIYLTITSTTQIHVQLNKERMCLFIKQFPYCLRVLFEHFSAHWSLHLSIVKAQ